MLYCFNKSLQGHKTWAKMISYEEDVNDDRNTESETMCETHAETYSH